MSVKQRLQVEPVYHLTSGDRVLAVVPSSLCAVGADNAPLSLQATQIISTVIEADLATQTPLRPLVLPLSGACLNESGIAEAAEAALQDSALCPQELVLEFETATLATAPCDPADLIRACRRRGFRVGIDARANWSVNLSGADWLMVDTLRLYPNALAHDGDLVHLVESASYAGVSVIAEAPLWRDGPALQAFGVEYALQPRADA